MCTISFFHFAGIFELPTFKVISFAILAETNFFFSAFLYSAQDLSYKIGKSWTLLIRVSISLIVEVHGVNGVGEGAVIWVEPFFFRLSRWFIFISLILKLYNQCPGRSNITSICCKNVFRKAIEKYSENVSNFSSCNSKLCFDFFFVLMKCKCQRNEKF